MTWTEERVDHLKRRWNDGATSSAIAGELGVSRSAVCGQVHRLHLSERKRPPQQQLKAARPSGSKSTLQALSRLEIARRDAEREDVPHPPSDGVPPPVPPRHLELVQLKADDCRWPFGDGPFTFCGHARYAGSYCEHHHMLACSAA